MSIQKFLDYDLRDCGKVDGIVLMKSEGRPYDNYEAHLGNYGHGEKGFDNAKKAAIVYFMIARPEPFATSIMRKVMRAGSGTMHEYYMLQRVLKEEHIDMPEEITCIGGINCLIGYKGEALTWEPVVNVDMNEALKANIAHIGRTLLQLSGVPAKLLNQL